MRVTHEITLSNTEMLRDVIDGLSRPQKELLPKYFYDQRGSELFEQITRLPEYYPTRTEAKLLRTFGAPWVQSIGARTLVELGAGNAEKTRILLDALPAGATYIPVDISAEFLAGVAKELQDDYPALYVQPSVSDISQALHLPAELQEPAVYAFLGSTVGNFERELAVRLIRTIRTHMRPGDRFLMGVDLKKDIRIIEAAYNDDQGVTAEFNLNILHVLNRELNADFDTSGFTHRAYYNESAARIEMHLVAVRDQAVNIPEWSTVRLQAGETIRTEFSRKYDEAAVLDMFEAAGLRIDKWQTDDQQWYALVVGRAGE